MLSIPTIKALEKKLKSLPKETHLGLVPTMGALHEGHASLFKKAVEEMYNVKVVSVNTMVYNGKTKSRFTRGGVINGKTNSTKRAVITLAEGETIDFYSNI